MISRDFDFAVVVVATFVVVASTERASEAVRRQKILQDYSRRAVKSAIVGLPWRN